MPLWSQGRSYGPAREGEAESRKQSEASVGRGKAELFPLQGDSGRLNLPMSYLLSSKTFFLLEEKTLTLTGYQEKIIISVHEGTDHRFDH